MKVGIYYWTSEGENRVEGQDEYLNNNRRPLHLHFLRDFTSYQRPLVPIRDKRTMTRAINRKCLTLVIYHSLQNKHVTWLQYDDQINSSYSLQSPLYTDGQGNTVVIFGSDLLCSGSMLRINIRCQTDSISQRASWCFVHNNAMPTTVAQGTKYFIHR